MAFKIIQLEAKDLVGQYLGFLIFNVSALCSKGDMRTEGGMKDKLCGLTLFGTLKGCQF